MGGQIGSHRCRFAAARCDRQVALAVSLLVLMTASGRRARMQTAAPGTAGTDTESAPSSLEMGGRKSVTRFFVTSRGLGRGGDLGGLAGADAHCQALAMAEGSGDHTWRAYLSATATKTTPAVNARDRIGTGPWYNALGDRVARDLDDLHSGLRITRENAVTERGDPIGRNMVEVLSGSRPDGRAFQGEGDFTCANWTSNGAGRAEVGRLAEPRRRATAANSWNSAHRSRGCSQSALRATEGAGLFYCFAID